MRKTDSNPKGKEELGSSVPPASISKASEVAVTTSPQKPEINEEEKLFKLHQVLLQAEREIALLYKSSKKIVTAFIRKDLDLKSSESILKALNLAQEIIDFFPRSKGINKASQNKNPFIAMGEKDFAQVCSGLVSDHLDWEARRMRGDVPEQFNLSLIHI